MIKRIIFAILGFLILVSFEAYSCTNLTPWAIEHLNSVRITLWILFTFTNTCYAILAKDLIVAYYLKSKRNIFTDPEVVCKQIGPGRMQYKIPIGYSKKEVEAFRKSLNIKENLIFDSKSGEINLNFTVAEVEKEIWIPASNNSGECFKDPGERDKIINWWVEISLENRVYYLGQRELVEVVTNQIVKEIYYENVLGYCKECDNEICIKDVMSPRYPNLYECSKCGHPHSKEDIIKC